MHTAHGSSETANLQYLLYTGRRRILQCFRCIFYYYHFADSALRTRCRALPLKHFNPCAARIGTAFNEYISFIFYYDNIVHGVIVLSSFAEVLFDFDFCHRRIVSRSFWRIRSVVLNKYSLPVDYFRSDRTCYADSNVKIYIYIYIWL